MRSFRWRRQRGWWSYELSWLSRWHMVRNCLDRWGNHLGKVLWYQNIWNCGSAVRELYKNFDILGWRVLLWLTVTEMKMIGKLFELKEGLTWVKEMEVKFLLIMIVISMMMIIDDDCDDCGENTSCNVSIMDSGNLMFPFSISWIGNSPLTITTTFGWRWEMDRRYPNLFHLSCWCRYYSYRSV